MIRALRGLMSMTPRSLMGERERGRQRSVIKDAGCANIVEVYRSFVKNITTDRKFLI